MRRADQHRTVRPTGTTRSSRRRRSTSWSRSTAGSPRGGSALLDTRRRRRARYADGAELPDFLPETAAIRDDPSWRVAPPAPGLIDRRVEITGPTDRKMTVNALNSGAKVWLADFEDATSPTWDNVIGGQLNLLDALDRRIDFTSPEGKRYALGDDLATIVVRPRGWHLAEKHIVVDGRADLRAAWSTSACTCSTARSGSSTPAAGRTSTCPSWRATARRGCGTTCSSSPRTTSASRSGTIRATVLIETITAAFEMEEILYELREHSRGPQRRPVGLHLQHHQELRPARRLRAARTGPRSR